MYVFVYVCNVAETFLTRTSMIVMRKKIFVMRESNYDLLDLERFNHQIPALRYVAYPNQAQ